MRTIIYFIVLFGFLQNSFAAKAAVTTTTTTTVPSLAAGTPEEAAVKEVVDEDQAHKAAMLEISKGTKVNWFKPEVHIDKKDKEFEKQQKISFVGEVKPGTRIYLLATKVFQILPDGTKKNILLKEDQTTHLPGVSDRRGIFLFQLALMQGNYEVGVSFVDPDAQSMTAAKTYMLKVGLGRGKVDFGFSEEADADAFKAQFDYFSGGLGLIYSVFNKQSDVPTEIRFSSFKLPSLRLGYASTFKKFPEWRLDSSLFLGPGETKTGTRVNVRGGSYYWTILSADALYSKPDWTKQWKDYRIRYAIRGGPQMHMLPFLKSIEATTTDQEISQATFGSLGVGGHLDILTDSEFSYSAYLRMTLPFTLMSNTSISSPLSFDGSLGGIYRPEKSKWSYGLYWYGQWLQFKFSEFDKFANRSVDGKFDIMFSNIEFRTMYNF